MCLSHFPGPSLNKIAMFLTALALLIAGLCVPTQNTYHVGGEMGFSYARKWAPVWDAGWIDAGMLLAECIFIFGAGLLLSLMLTQADISASASARARFAKGRVNRKIASETTDVDPNI